jgi:hypothetical protein
VVRILNQIRDAGFDGIPGLLAAMMESPDDNMKRRLSRLLDSRPVEQFAGLVLKRRTLSGLSDLPDESKTIEIPHTLSTRALALATYLPITGEGAQGDLARSL